MEWSRQFRGYDSDSTPSTVAEFWTAVREGKFNDTTDDGEFIASLRATRKAWFISA